MGGLGGVRIEVGVDLDRRRWMHGVAVGSAMSRRNEMVVCCGYVMISWILPCVIVVWSDEVCVCEASCMSID